MDFTRRKLEEVRTRILRWPIFDFYFYMWQTNRKLFLQTVTLNYVWPLAAEMMPWFLNQRLLAKHLRDQRNMIQHRLIAGSLRSVHRIPGAREALLGQGRTLSKIGAPGQLPSPSVMMLHVVWSILYACIQTAEQWTRTRLLLANRFVVKRLIMQRILYSEVGSLQARYRLVFGEEVNTEKLENQLFADISETLNLFTFTFPNIVRALYTFWLNALDLWNRRHSIDLLAITRPALVGLFDEILNTIRRRVYVERQTLAMQSTNRAMSHVVSNIIDGLAELQVNNMQGHQIHRLDEVGAEELDVRQGGLEFLNRVYRIVNNRSVFDFISEVYIVRHVMEKRNIDHETYRQIQNDVEYVNRQGFRIVGMVREALEILSFQRRLMLLIHLPTFQDEASASQDFVLPEFRCLCFREVYFRYPGTQEARPALAFGGRKHRRRRRKSSFSSQESMDGLVELEETGEEEEEEEMGNGNPSDHNEDGFAGTERLEDHLCFRAGRVYAVVGRNRSGKSTLMQLLCKIHGQQGSRDEEAERREAAAPDGKDSKRRRQKDGEERNRLDVWLNGCSDDSVEMEFSRIPRVAWRNCLSYIPQHPFIFQGTIADNIRMARPDASPEEVLRAAQAAGVFQMEDDPASLPTSTTAASGGGGGGGGGRDRRSSPSDRRNSLTDQPLPEYTEADAELRRLGSLPVRRKPWEENRLANGVFAALDWLSRRLPGVSLNPKQDDGDLPRGDIFSEENGSSAWEGKTAMHTATEAAAAATTTAVSTMMLEAEAEHHRKILGIQTEASGLNLSGGFAQSVALARLYLRPESKIVILDEAMARMDGVKKRENILPNLLKFAREKNVCLIVVTHDLASVCHLVDEVVVLDQGKVVQKGTHDELSRIPGGEYARLLGHPGSDPEHLNE